MANGTPGELKGRVIGIGRARVSGDNAQIALIDDYLRCQGRCGGSDQRYEAEAGRRIPTRLSERSSSSVRSKSALRWSRAVS